MLFNIVKYLTLSVNICLVFMFIQFPFSAISTYQVFTTKSKSQEENAGKGMCWLSKTSRGGGGGGVQKQGPLVTTYWTLQEIFGWPHLDLDHSKFSVLVCIPTIQPCYTKGLGRKPTNYSSLDILVHFLKCQHYILCLRLRNGGSTNLIWYAVWNMPYWHDYQRVIIVPV